MWIESVAEIVQRLARVRWEWTLNGWERMSRELALELLETSEASDGRTRYSYRFHSTFWLSAHFRAGYPISVDVTLEHREACDDPEERVDETLEEAILSRCRLAVQRIEPVLGAPLFCGSSAKLDAPHNSDATWLTVWSITNARIHLEEWHQGWGTPFLVQLLVQPWPQRVV